MLDRSLTNPFVQELTKKYWLCRSQPFYWSCNLRELVQVVMHVLLCDISAKYLHGESQSSMHFSSMMNQSQYVIFRIYLKFLKYFVLESKNCLRLQHFKNYTLFRCIVVLLNFKLKAIKHWLNRGKKFFCINISLGFEPSPEEGWRINCPKR